MPGPLKNIGLLVFSIVVFKIFGKLLNNRSAPPHCPPLHQCYWHKRGEPRRCHGGRGRALGARAWAGTSGPSSRGHLSSAPGVLWHGGLGLVLHKVGLLLLLAPLCLIESVFLTLFRCF
jgi:hypothetical protein